jgi:hypothetical protein
MRVVTGSTAMKLTAGNLPQSARRAAALPEDVYKNPEAAQRSLIHALRRTA